MPTIESAAIQENLTNVRLGCGDYAENPILKLLFSGKRLKIMGPCALASFKQIEDMWRIIGGHADVLRAPVQKPRTTAFSAAGIPNFAGVGIPEGKRILQEVKRSHPKVLIAQEVMFGADIPQLQGVIDLPWVGSRSAGAFQICQDIGHAAERSNLPLMVKNPMNRSLDSLIGALEFAIKGAGLALPILLCLRGNEPVGEVEEAWRNVPNLHLLGKLKAAFPDLKIIIDPSHMFKKDQLKPEKVAEMVKKGVEEGADGYILELHTPDHPSKTDPGTDAEDTLNRLVQLGVA